MKLFLIFTILFLIIKSKSKAETIECVFKFWQFESLNENIYYCDVENREIFSSSLRSVSIDNAIGEHKDKHTNGDVKGLVIFAKNIKMNYFPSKIDGVFKNLIFIGIVHGSLSKITKEDLKPFPKLKVLYLFNNDIEFISEDLFVYNQELEVIMMDRNKIKHIDKMAFSRLKNLKILWLDNNVCKLVNSNKRSATLIMMKQIEKGSCQSENIAMN